MKMTNAVPAVEIEKLCFRYDEQEILHNVNLTVNVGDFVVFVGPNGGGKTTLLKLILGLLKPRFGKIRVFGKRAAKARKMTAYVPQSMAFDAAFPATVLDIVLMGRVERQLFGPYSKKDREIARAALQDVGLAELADRPFSDLSGGQRQRTLIARALAAEPQLLLLDEPNANLDPGAAQAVNELLKKLNKKLTVIMVSHNLNRVEPFASHIVCVNHTVEIHCLKDMQSVNLQGWAQIQHENDCPLSSNKSLFTSCQGANG